MRPWRPRGTAAATLRARAMRFCLEARRGAVLPVLGILCAGTGMEYLSEGGLLFDEFFLWLVGTCLLALALVALGLVAGACGLVARHRGARRAGMRMFAWAVGLVVLLPVEAWSGEALRFAVLAPALRGQARDDAAPGEPGFAMRMTWSGPGGASGYLYDASGEIELADDRRSPAWHRRTARSGLADCVAASPMAGGYHRWWADDACLAAGS